MFLIPEIGGYDNPFFTYALSHFLASDRFRKGDLQLKQKTLSIPLSAFTDPVGTKDQIYFGTNNINAIEQGWRYNKHSDYQELPFFTIGDWYDVIFGAIERHIGDSD